MTEHEAAGICKALGELNRIKIVRSLANGSKCASRILSELDITQPTLSHHMKFLTECGLAVTKRCGKNTVYTLCCKKLDQFKAFISELECLKNSDNDCPDDLNRDLSETETQKNK